MNSDKLFEPLKKIKICKKSNGEGVKGKSASPTMAARARPAILGFFFFRGN